MATTKKTKATKAVTRATAAQKRRSASVTAGGQDAIALLEADHREVEGYFAQYEKLEGDSEKKALADKICSALKVHTQIEEEIFYPAARKATGDDDLLDEATVEHAGAKSLIAQIEASEPGQGMYDAKVKVLGEQIHHHVEEEEDELFPEVRKAKVDLKALGAQMTARRAELSGAASKPKAA